jgi:glycosyltransferase involved in cell wall biosynthesis
MKILYVCHGHPSLAKGGGEIAAWRLFEYFSERYGAEACGFLAAAPTAGYLPPGCEVMSMDYQQWLIKPSSNSIIHDTAVSLRRGGQLYQALASFQPDLIHLHHYLHVGIDLFHALHHWYPQAKFVFTLHEYWGLCPVEGRLLRYTGELCYGASQISCNECLGGKARNELAIRSQRIQRFFSVIDHFVSPSFFLKKIYINWGISSRKISVIENLPPGTRVSDQISNFDRQLSPDQSPLRLGFFGQVNQWKGLHLILEAILLVQERGEQITLAVNGLASSQLALGVAKGDPYMTLLSSLISSASQGTVFLQGVYESSDLTLRFSQIDLTVMGSIWFENSPMVIQESLAYGVPLLVPALGGMQEKVKSGKTGYLYDYGSATSIANELSVLCQNRSLLSGLRAASHRPNNSTIVRPALCHELLYNRLTADSATSL